MSEVEVTERGEIVVRGQNGDVWAYQNPGDDAWWVCAEEDDTRLTDDQLAAWCRRVLREVEGDTHAAGDELMRVLGGLVGDPGRSAEDDAWMRRTLDILRRRTETDPAWEPVPVDAELREVDPDPAPRLDEDAICADERAKAEAEVVAFLKAKSREAEGSRAGDLIAGALLAMMWDIRAGKHRGTP